MFNSTPNDFTVQVAVITAVIVRFLLLCGKRIPSHPLLNCIPGWEHFYMRHGSPVGGIAPEKNVFFAAALALLYVFAIATILVGVVVALFGIGHPAEIVLIALLAVVEIFVYRFLVTGPPVPQDPLLSRLPGYDWYQRTYGAPIGSAPLGTKSLLATRLLLAEIAICGLLLLLTISLTVGLKLNLFWFATITMLVGLTAKVMLIFWRPMIDDAVLEYWYPGYEWLRTNVWHTCGQAKSVVTCRLLAVVFLVSGTVGFFAGVSFLPSVAAFCMSGIYILIIVVYVHMHWARIHPWLQKLRKPATPPATP